MKTTRRLALGGALALALAPLGAAAQEASEFPDGPIQFIVPYSAGGGQDQWARAVAQAAPDQFGVPMNVEVRAGAGSTIGWQYLLDQPADGQTIMISSISPMISVLSEENPPMDIDQIRMVAQLSDFNPQLMSAPDTEWDSWEELKAYAEENPGSLTVGGTLAQVLAAATVFDQAGLDAIFVPYPGTSEAVTDMLGGHIGLAVVTPTTAASLGDTAVPVLNVGSRPNSEALVSAIGDVPWVGDLGYDGLPQPRFVGVHPDTPDEIVAALDEGLAAAVEDERVLEFAETGGEEVIYAGHEETQATYERLRDTIRKNLPLIQ